LRLRRQKLGMEHGTEANPNWFGIALYRRGIRSATINLGFLKTLNKYGILQKADYLSSVSGGGYTHAYVQGAAKETGDFNKLFNPVHVEAMRAHGEYMVPKTGPLGKNGNLVIIIIAFVVSWLMSLVSPVIVGGIAYSLYMVIASLVGKYPFLGLNFLSGIDLTWWAMAIPRGATCDPFFIQYNAQFQSGDFQGVQPPGVCTGWDYPFA
jgi:hypothetical protein